MRAGYRATRVGEQEIRVGDDREGGAEGVHGWGRDLSVGGGGS